MARAPHEELRDLCSLALALVDEIPAAARPGSPRDKETIAERAKGVRGLARIALLDELNVDAQIGAANLTLIAGGVGDCLEIAAGRDNEVNVPILSIIARTALEIAGQLAWLLDDSIDGTERARRFLTWRFGDLRTQRLLLDDFRPSNEAGADAAAELDKIEQELRAAATSAGWVSKATVTPGKNLEAAALLDADGKNERVPKSGELARFVSSTPSVYPLLSIPAHGVRFGMRQNMQVEDEPVDDGTHRVRVGGFGVPPNLAIGLSVVAIDRACRLLAGWNGVDAQRLHSAATEIMRRAGLD